MTDTLNAAEATALVQLIEWHLTTLDELEFGHFGHAHGLDGPEEGAAGVALFRTLWSAREKLLPEVPGPWKPGTHVECAGLYTSDHAGGPLRHPRGIVMSVHADGRVRVFMRDAVLDVRAGERTWIAPRELRVLEVSNA